MQQGIHSRRAPSAPPVASFRLTRGGSARAVWVVEGRAGAKPLTIGSDPGCDWPIRAASVPAHALFVLIDEHHVYVHAGLEGQVRINGRRLGRAWQLAKGEARFDIGLARIEVEVNDHRFVPEFVEPQAAASTPEAADGTDPDHSGVRPSFLPKPVSVPKAKRSLRKRPSRNSLPEVPTVLGKATQTSVRLGRYLLASLAIASAYVCWLLLLDS
jgi:hypothetical protein